MGLIVLVLLAGEPKVSGQPILVAVGGASGALAAGVFLTERWLHDKLTSSDYGELVGAVDPDSRTALLPFAVVSLVGLLSLVVNLVVAAVVGELSGLVRDLGYAVASGLGAWTVFGVLGVMAITRGHMRRMSEMDSLRRRLERERRDRSDT